jgi:hypothetical protein
MTGGTALVATAGPSRAARRPCVFATTKHNVGVSTKGGAERDSCCGDIVCRSSIVNLNTNVTVGIGLIFASNARRPVRTLPKGAHRAIDGPWVQEPIPDTLQP